MKPSGVVTLGQVAARLRVLAVSCNGCDRHGRLQTTCLSTLLVEREAVLAELRAEAQRADSETVAREAIGRAAKAEGEATALRAELAAARRTEGWAEASEIATAAAPQ